MRSQRVLPVTVVMRFLSGRGMKFWLTDGRIVAHEGEWGKVEVDDCHGASVEQLCNQFLGDNVILGTLTADEIAPRTTWQYGTRRFVSQLFSSLNRRITCLQRCQHPPSDIPDLDSAFTRASLRALCWLMGRQVLHLVDGTAVARIAASNAADLQRLPKARAVAGLNELTEALETSGEPQFIALANQLKMEAVLRERPRRTARRTPVPARPPAAL